MSSLDPETIARLLAKDKEKPKRSGKRKKKDTRDYDTWFHGLEHIIDGTCEVTEHTDNVMKFTFITDEDREHALSPNRVIAVVNDIRMCRYCFLSGAGSLDKSSEGV